MTKESNPFQPEFNADLAVSLRETNLDTNPNGYMLIDIIRAESMQLAASHRVEYTDNVQTICTEYIFDPDARDLFEGLTTTVIETGMEIRPNVASPHQLFFDEDGNPLAVRIGDAKIVEISEVADVIPIGGENGSSAP
jgi:hypothetical protein